MRILNSRPGAFILAAVVVLIDQISKRIAANCLELGEPVRIAGEVIRFALRYNEGAAFSFSWGGPVFLTVFSIAAAALVSVLIVKCRDCTRGSFLALGAILGGALGNLTDRILYGMVIDFIDIGTHSWRWPTFNAADIAICIGGISLLLLYHGRKSSGTGSGNVGEENP